MTDEPAGSVAALYVSPLRALINDQFRRLEALCAGAKIPVHRWHSDVSASRKRALIRKPSGVLLTTPESIESLCINRSRHLNALFGGLQFVLVDEMHAFMGTERGAHTRSLIARVMRKSSGRVRLAGLSATLGDIEGAKRWLCPGEPGRVCVIEEEKVEKETRYSVRAYLRRESTVSNRPDSTAGAYRHGPRYRVSKRSSRCGSYTDR